jgi:DNA polymerase elongation subunit (family B)
MKQKMQYENIFVGNNKLYARVYDPETNESELKTHEFVPNLYIKTEESTDFKSPITKEYLKEIQPKTMREYKNTVQMYQDTKVTLYGNANRDQCFIKENWPNPLESDHEFHTWYIDIETMVDKSDPNHDKALDWKPYGSLRGATAIITSIQIYDTKHEEFYILGLKKDWNNDNNYESPHGKIIYRNLSSEENLLKMFISILQKRNPALLVGFNSFGYDFPYITNRIIRVLDERDDIFLETKKGTVFNTECLNGAYVKQLSPVGLIRHRVQETNYGPQDHYQWIGMFLEDYRELYLKYTFTTLTSYSLESVASHELGDSKINHDEFSDFGDFYENNYNLFIEYGIKDVELLIDLENKLKLIELNKIIAYTCGVNYNDVSGTVKQWNSYMYNEYYKEGYILPMKQYFSSDDEYFINWAMVNKDKVPENRLSYYEDLHNKNLKSQRFPGGVTRGTAKFWKWVCSFDYASLYPSVIQWANIGMETLILPKDLPDELLQLRAKYAIFYSKETNPKELTKYDYEYMNRVLYNKEAQDEMNRVLTKYNVTMTPNGMFFRKDERSLISTLMENTITNRKVHKKNMKKYKQEIEDLKTEKEELLKHSSTTKEHTERMQALQDEIQVLQAKVDKEDVFQMGLKILANSAYGALSNKGTLFAGHPEYFSGAVTSGARISNITQAQAISRKICEIADIEPSEKEYIGTEYESLNYYDAITQIDTDSCYFSLDPVIRKKFGDNYEETVSDDRLLELSLNFVQKVAYPVTSEVLNKEHSYSLNAYLPEKLQLDHEIVASKFISVAPKMYYARKYWEEGIKLSKPKLKITGLSTVRANTPKFYREELYNAMEILLDGDLKATVNYISNIRAETYNQPPEMICINQGVSSLDYSYDEVSKRWRRWVKESSKYLSAPVNSRAALIHNKFIEDNELSYKFIEGGDKIGFLYMKMPNYANSNVFAFLNPAILEEKELIKYIDYETMFEKGFLQSIKNITDPLGWSLETDTEAIDESEW